MFDHISLRLGQLERTRIAAFDFTPTMHRFASRVPHVINYVFDLFDIRHRVPYFTRVVIIIVRLRVGFPSSIHNWLVLHGIVIANNHSDVTLELRRGTW